RRAYSPASELSGHVSEPPAPSAMAPTRETRLEAFTRLARIGASRGDDVHALLHEACELAVAKLGLDRCVVYRLLASDEIVPVVTCGEPALEHVGGGVGTLADRPLFRRAVEAAETVVVSGPGEDPILQAEGTTVIAPMLGRDGCLGFLAGTDGDLAPDAARRPEEPLHRPRLARAPGAGRRDPRDRRDVEHSARAARARGGRPPPRGPERADRASRVAREPAARPVAARGGRDRAQAPGGRRARAGRQDRHE